MQTYVLGGGTNPLIGNIDTVSAAADDVLQYNIGYDGRAVITGCDKSAVEVDIPSEINGFPVFRISAAFKDCTNLKSVTIPDSVDTMVGAFIGCTSLKSITIPDSVTTMGADSFYRCTNLESIYVSENNPEYSSADGVLFNKDKTKLICFPNGKSTEYVIPDSVTEIGEAAFQGCTSLESVTIPDSVTSIGYYAFYWCTNLKSVTILNPECEICGNASTISNGSDEFYNGVICGYENSTAQKYAEECGYKFESLDKKPDITADGDVNDNGRADLYDAIIICNIMIGNDVPEEQRKRADVDGNGVIDLYDAIYVAECMAGLPHKNKK